MLGCKDPAQEQAQRLVRDRAQLDAVVKADVEAERALGEVGDAEKKRAVDDAAALLDSKVLPAADKAIALAKGAQLETVWGNARRDEMLSAMNDRRDELPRYGAALRAHDFEAQLASVEKQLAIEKRAMAAAQAIQDGPEPGAK